MRSITHFSSRWMIACAILLVVGIGLIDFFTGYEVTFFPFYSIPILLTLWFAGRLPAILMAVVCALIWWWADRASGHAYSQEWLRIWDTMVRLMFFCLVVTAGAAFRQQRDATRAKIEFLERTQKLEQEIIGISEREQQRIGRDLHDGLGQHLVAIGFAADSLQDYLKGESLPGAGAVAQIAGLLREAVTRARDLSRGLSPVDRDEGGLESALEELALSASRLSGIPCSVLCEGTLAIYDPTKVIHLFRIAQEAVTNAVKHAQAKAITIAVDTDEHSLALRICDDGVGGNFFGAAKTGMGLNIMHYRARMIGAKLEFGPNSPTGTVVSCAVEGVAFAQLCSKLAKP